jgi:hypothetical protein
MESLVEKFEGRWYLLTASFLFVKIKGSVILETNNLDQKTTIYIRSKGYSNNWLFSLSQE